jgi:Holliday junction resolvasome RuvABC DNA-binding subunit
VTDTNTAPDVKAFLADADRIVDPLPWQLGDSEAQRKRSRGRVSALAHQVAALLATGWTAEQIRAALETATEAVTAPDAGAQERRWRAALKRARHERREQDRRAEGDA